VGRWEVSGPQELVGRAGKKKGPMIGWAGGGKRKERGGEGWWAAE
jgi:hypothetical protein